MTWTNALNYSGQILGLIVATALLLRILRVRDAALRLRIQQFTLLACLALPFVQTRQPAAKASAIAPIYAEDILPGAVRRNISAETVWSIGCALVLVRLAAGLYALRRLRKGSMEFEMRGDVPIRLSSQITSPVAFGFIRPIVLLPKAAADLASELREPMIAHEVAHLERRDWIDVLAEELLRAALWFHPAVWWTLAQIRADREQAIDCKIADQAGPHVYAESLLTAASWKIPNSYPAAAMYSGGSLKQRLQLIANYKETYMTRLHRATAVSALTLATLGITGVASSALPLFAAGAQEKEAESSSVKLIKKVTPAYPPEAKAARIQGVVRFDTTIGKDGSVINIQLLNGHPLLAQAAMDALQQWEFEPVTKDGKPVEITTTIDIHFTLSK